MFFSAWRVGIFLEDYHANMSAINASNSTSPNPIPDEIWATRVGVYAIGGTAIAAFGLLCNSISIVVLANFRQKSCAPFLLICLEVVDCLLLLSEMMLETLATLSQAQLLSDSYRDFIRPIYVVMYPLPHIAQTCTTMMTVLITLERFIAVARPLLASTVCTKTWARRAVLVILLWSLLFHVPLYLAYTYDHVPDPATNTSRIVFHRTALGESQFYNYWFVVWINLACEFLLPFLLIVVFNVLMIRALQASKTSLQASTTSASTATSSKRSAREGRLTGMVIAITVIFFVCELFPAVALIIVRGKDAFSECSAACAHFVSVADTMVLLNSGVNFVAYCAIGKQFRDIFARIFLRRRGGDGRRREKLQLAMGEFGTSTSTTRCNSEVKDLTGAEGTYHQHHNQHHQQRLHDQQQQQDNDDHQLHQQNGHHQHYQHQHQHHRSRGLQERRTSSQPLNRL
ncbi:FMRFamide receptor-like [Littorina saxatilis]|uniref:G-protein coupled receptors family 1 profile domain-containing protein n=1 Tax=Littorina saxatilis TaxID=31220 RepID=A0AAN9AIF2_9CAEN